MSVEMDEIDEWEMSATCFVVPTATDSSDTTYGNKESQRDNQSAILTKKDNNNPKKMKKAPKTDLSVNNFQSPLSSAIRLHIALLSSPDDKKTLFAQFRSLTKLLTGSQHMLDNKKLLSIFLKRKDVTIEMIKDADLATLKNGDTIYFSEDQNHWVLGECELCDISHGNSSNVRLPRKFKPSADMSSHAHQRKYSRHISDEEIQHTIRTGARFDQCAQTLFCVDARTGVVVVINKRTQEVATTYIKKGGEACVKEWMDHKKNRSRPSVMRDLDPDIGVHMSSPRRHPSQKW